MLSPLDGTKRHRFINLRHYAVRNNISRSRFTISHIETAFQRAALLTKPVSRVLL